MLHVTIACIDTLLTRFPRMTLSPTAISAVVRFFAFFRVQQGGPWFRMRDHARLLGVSVAYINACLPVRLEEGATSWLHQLCRQLACHLFAGHTCACQARSCTCICPAHVHCFASTRGAPASSCCRGRVDALQFDLPAHTWVCWRVVCIKSAGAAMS